MNKQLIRDAKLRGIRAATEVHVKLGLREKIKEGLGQVDIFDSINELDIAILCKPLDGLLGAYISKPNKGIIVTTNRRLPIQRFTAAHELGHFWLKHEESFDSEESIGFARQGVATIPIQEIEAEAFASEFLLPKLLIIRTAKKMGWNPTDFKNPDIVYQLSLRTGTSCEATRLALLENKLIDFKTEISLREVQPKIAKNKIIKEKKLVDSWADVFLIKFDDNGSTVQASPEDRIVIELPEHSSGGYLWSKIHSNEGVELINDETIHASNHKVGSINKRRLSLQGNTRTEIHIEEKRPWEEDKKPLETFEITINFDGKEKGLPRAART